MNPDQSPAPLRPAASMLFLRDGAKGLEVFMVKRSGALDFAAGMLVFPGGKVAPGDHALAQQIEAPLLDQAYHAHGVAALRESFEEAGLLLARTRDGTLVGSEQLAALQAQRQRIADDADQFSGLLDSECLLLCARQLVRFAHIIAPKVAARRFDTHFFIAPVPHGQEAMADMHEVVSAGWYDPRALLESGKEAAGLMRPTRLVLARLARSTSVEAAINDAVNVPPPPIEPKLVERDGIHGLLTEDHPAFPGDFEPVSERWARSIGLAGLNQTRL
jgi:8-oxo-dGTP pyrophosphatase MutT (NUDIX family)